MPDDTIRVIITLPRKVLNLVDQVVKDGKAKSRTQFVASALEHELYELERAAVDAAFAGMSNDKDYQEEVRQIMEDFADSDWESFRMGEGRG